MSLRLPLTLLVAALLVTGCGGTASPATLAEYQASITKTRDRVDFALSRITKAEDKSGLLDRMDEASAAIEKAADELDDAGVAEGFERETSQFSSALHQLSFDLSATASDLRRPEGEALISGAQGVNFESWDQANLALAKMIGKGLKVELIGRH